MSFLRYWLLVLRRAVAEAWRILVPRSFASLIRDAVILIVAMFHIFQGDLVRRHLSSADNLEDTIVWAITIVISGATIVLVVFIIQLFLFSHYLIWRDINAQVQACLSVSTEAQDEIILRFDSLIPGCIVESPMIYKGLEMKSRWIRAQVVKLGKRVASGCRVIC